VSRYSQRIFVGQQVSQFGKAGAPEMITKVDRFTATDASYTVPAGVTYMVAHITAGGGGVGRALDAGAGGNSSVAFAGGTITATGGLAMQRNTNYMTNATAGNANSGDGAQGFTTAGNDNASWFTKGHNGNYIVAGGAVTAGDTLAITVGAGGVAGTSGAAGGSGYVYLEYQVKA
jgi:hypothetical protein